MEKSVVNWCELMDILLVNINQILRKDFNHILYIILLDRFEEIFFMLFINFIKALIDLTLRTIPFQ